MTKQTPKRTSKQTPKKTNLLLRFLYQDRNDPLAVRLLPRLVFALAAVYTLFTIASQSGEAFVTVCALLVLGAAGWLLRRRGQLLLALASTVVTAAFTGYFSAAGESARLNTSATVTGQAAFGYWALAGMALLGAWMVKDHPGRRGLTVVFADVILVMVSVVGMFVPDVGVPLGLLGALGVLALRGGTGKTLVRWARRGFERLRPHKKVKTADS
jgi:hypothetical protein